MTARPLSGIRVVDFTWWRAGPWATRILACLGADVIKVEWPQMPLAYYRDRVSAREVPEGVDPALNNNPFFSENSAGKRSVTVNLRSPGGIDAVKRLIAVSDVVVENFSAGLLARRGLSYAEMRALRPDIVYVSMAGLGHTGRYHEYKTFGPVVHALSGLTQLSGLPDAEPALWRWAYMDDTGGMYGALCTLVALHHRLRTSDGQHVDLAQVSAAMPLTGAAWLDFTVNGRPTRRPGFPPGNRAAQSGTLPLNAYRGPTTAPHNTYPTASSAPEDAHNAWCTIACFDDNEWSRLVQLMGNPEWAAGPKFASLKGRLEHQDELDASLDTWTRRYDKYAITTMCQAVGVHAIAVQDARDKVELDPQLAARGLLQELPHRVIGPLRYQRLPFTGSEMALSLRSAGPLAGQHNREILCDLLGIPVEQVRAGYADGTFWPPDVPLESYLFDDLEARARPSPPRPAAPAANGHAASTALSDLRVVELGDAKGQWAAKLLGDLGADVIKVEPPDGCPERRIGPFFEDTPHPDRSLAFWHANTSKRSVTIDLESEAGRAMLRQLVPTADVVIESYAPGYLRSLALDYESLRALKPDLIMCSVTSFGQTGPWRDYVGSDLLHLAAGGQMAICGYDEEEHPGAPPLALGGGQAWFMGGHYAAIAIMSAIHQRDTTGVGQYLDVSIHEACALTTEGHVPRYLSHHEISERNRRYRSIDREQFRCRDGTYLNSQWSSEMTPDHLAVLAYWMDDYGCAGDLLDDQYQDQAVITASTNHIAELLAHFFEKIDAEEAFRGAQERGFAFGPVRTVEDNLVDEHWADRGFFVSVLHPELEREFVYPGAYALFSATPWAMSRRPPTLGEHTAEVLGPLSASARVDASAG
jgi:crotonobetainyl-CoA:carnitine CoA-transferase CaiB-like acyl-CoA transferase